MADKTHNTLENLILEYQKSGMKINEFIKKKLIDSGRKDADKCVDAIDKTLSNIDKLYSDLQKQKADGYTREDWLRTQISEAGKDLDTASIGKIVSATTKGIDGESGFDADADFSGVDAVVMVKKLDDALVRNTCSSLGALED